MIHSTQQRVLTDFWHALAKAQRGVLMLDYDGTLAPFHPDPTQAFPYPSLVPFLQRLNKDPHMRLVIVSGRAIEALIPLLPFETLPELWGTHGYERLIPNGAIETMPHDPLLPTLLDDLEQTFRNLGWLDRCERKPASFAFHWRGDDPDEQARREQTTQEIFSHVDGQAGLRLYPFNGGLEVRLADCTKGRAVETILQEEATTPIAYLGDDTTDEDAFQALQGKGLPILVSKEERPTAAEIRLSPPDGVEAFLTSWEQIISLKVNNIN